ncbi:MAG: DUF3127 domain-containing protein [Prevotella sp.]|nr:DUF3127 domain-containing protein [Prevotella sp.]MBQ8701348.1 DUF3127 domain-containing protein [Prevotella sp.]
MEIEGKIIAVLEERSGVSAKTGNAWRSQEFVIETHDQYPRKCCFRVFGDERLKQMNIQAGEELRVSFDIDCHEYQGRWFNDISAWRVERIDPMAAQAAAQGVQAAPVAGAVPPPPASAAPFAPTAEGEAAADDLPF